MGLFLVRLRERGVGTYTMHGRVMQEVALVAMDIMCRPAIG